MSERHEETTARIAYPGEVTLNLTALSGPLTERLHARGFDFDVIGTTGNDELIFSSRSVIVTIRRDDSPDVIVVAVQSPVSAQNPRDTARARFSACACAVTHFVSSQCAERVVWQHKGRSYVTRPDAATQSADRPVRRALPAPPPPQDEIEPLPLRETEVERRDRLIELRRDMIEGDTPAQRLASQSVPHKLAIYTMNTSLMVVSMPIGAGMLTYNLLKGGSLTATSRALALTGMGVGLNALAVTQSAAANSDLIAAGQTLLNLFGVTPL